MIEMTAEKTTSTYTCNDYRAEMRLLGLNRRLAEAALTENERKQLISEIQALETEMDM
jgi:hypothetical protein